MAAASTASCYSPLDPTSKTIRLLLLSPNLNANDGRIQCSLVETPLDGARPYEALSYTWGAPDDLELKIYLDSTLTTVRRNLWAALCSLQKDISHDRVLWIDALCIHQEDMKERNHQVGFMGEIYKQAEVVLAWLGEPSDAALHDEIFSDCQHDKPTTRHKRTTYSPKLAFDMLRAAAAGADALNIDIEMMVPIDRLDGWFMEFGQSTKFTAQWKLVLEICNVEYWNRLWIVQEIGLAKRVKVLYGNAHCDWDDFSIPISILSYWRDTFDRSGNDPSIPFSVLSGLRASSPETSLGFAFKGSTVAKFVEREFRRPGGMMRSGSLTSLLSISENSHCQERKDRIYGLLSFLRDERVQIPVDYSKTLYQIFEDVIKSVTQQYTSKPALLVHFSEALQRALLAPLGKESDPCQMFEEETVSTLWGNGQQGNHSDKKCTTFQREKCAGIKLMSKNEEFKLHAKIVGPIRVVGVPVENIVVNNGDVSFKIRPEGQGQTPRKRRRTGNANEPSSEDHDIQWFLDYNASSLRDLWRADHQVLAQFEPAQPTNRSPSMPQNEFPNQVALIEVNVPKLSLERDKYIGVVSSNVQNGDLLCAFPPSEVTAVIRPCSADGESKDGKYSTHHQYAQCSFIGRAVVSGGYVHGLDKLASSGQSNRNWPPPHFSFGSTILNQDHKSGTMAPRRSNPFRKDRNVPTLPESARITITLKELQALTCPLKRRNSDREKT